MIFEYHTPNPPMDRYIESILYYEDYMPDHSIERVVPTGHIFLIFELDGIPRITFDNETRTPVETFTEAWISGMQTGCITISSHAHSAMCVVQFKPAGAYPFLHLPLNELNDRIVPAREKLGDHILHVRAALLREETVQKKFALVDEFLTKVFDEIKVPSDEFLTTLIEIQQEPVSRLSEIVEQYPNTQKHLIDQFKKYVGLTPKVYQRIVRFNEIFRKIQDREQITWAEIAYECGYSDQSHFIKEFKHFSGFNPQEFIERELHTDDPNFFPLD